MGTFLSAFLPPLAASLSAGRAGDLSCAPPAGSGAGTATGTTGKASEGGTGTGAGGWGAGACTTRGGGSAKPAAGATGAGERSDPCGGPGAWACPPSEPGEFGGRAGCRRSFVALPRGAAGPPGRSPGFCDVVAFPGLAGTMAGADGLTVVGAWACGVAIVAPPERFGIIGAGTATEPARLGEGVTLACGAPAGGDAVTFAEVEGSAGRVWVGRTPVTEFREVDA